MNTLTDIKLAVRSNSKAEAFELNFLGQPWVEFSITTNIRIPLIDFELSNYILLQNKIRLALKEKGCTDIKIGKKIYDEDIQYIHITAVLKDSSPKEINDIIDNFEDKYKLEENKIWLNIYRF